METCYFKISFLAQFSPTKDISFLSSLFTIIKRKMASVSLHCKSRRFKTANIKILSALNKCIPSQRYDQCDILSTVVNCTYCSFGVIATLRPLSNSHCNTVCTACGISIRFVHTLRSNITVFFCANICLLSVTQ